VGWTELGMATGVAVDQPADQAIVGLIQWLWSFRRLWVAAWNRHSERTRGSASSLEPAEAVVELVLGEDRLDCCLAVLVELVSGFAGEHPAHERVGPFVPARPGALS
jgi:hypothetical protein